MKIAARGTSHNSSEKRLEAFLYAHQEEIAAATPGFVVQAYQGGRLRIDTRWGDHYPYYDLASLTKIIFTASVTARAVADGVIKAGDSIDQHWPEFPFARLKLEQLWTHTAGLPWWRPFYKKMNGPRTPAARWPLMRRELVRLKRERHARAVYSDPDLLVTSEVLQRATGLSLLEMWQAYARPEWTGEMHFNLGTSNGATKRIKSKSVYAPTERCPWRGRVLQGEVHDENCFALGGIAPHAGLFGRVEDVARWGLKWREAWLKGSPDFLPSATARMFTRRRTGATVGDWGWLFMKPTKGRASCGRYFSAASFGHTGFTGTSFWFDPKQDLMIILLSNRVHPTRENNQFLTWRPRLHEAICESLGLGRS